MFGYSLSLAKPRVNSFTPEALEYFARASVTDPLAKQDINTFILGCQQLGIWDKLVYVPCLPSHGGRNQLGGATQLTTTPWALVNATDEAAGVRIVRNGILNYLRTDQTVNGSDASGVSFGQMSYQDVTDGVFLTISTMIGSVAVSNQILASSSYGAIQAQNIRFIGGSNVPVGVPIVDNVNSYRLSRMHGGSTNGTSTINYLTENDVDILTHTSAVGFAASRLAYYPITNANSQSGVIQGAFLYYDTFSTLGNAVWKLFRNLIAQTMLSRLTTRGNTRLLVSGQSNAVSENTIPVRQVVSHYTLGPNELYFAGIGGVSITAWTGTSPYSRQARYRSDFWSNITPARFQDMWLKSGRYQNVIYWFQGESDNGDQATSLAYYERVSTLLNWIREDYADPNLYFVVALIDASPAYRSGTGAGAGANFTVSGFTGGLSVLNGTWTFVAITGVSDPYVWNNGIYQLSLNGNVWQFVNTTTSSVMASSASIANIAHPAIASGWTDSTSNAVSPAFTWSRTEGIERVRKAQRDVCNVIPNSSYFDTRQFARRDDVHILDANYAPSLRAHLLANLP